MSATVNITVETHADFFQAFQYMQPDGVSPISIVGATFTFGVRQSLADPNALFKVTSAGNTVTINKVAVPNGQIQILDGPNGIFGLWISIAQIQAAPLGVWQQAMLITQPAVPPAFPPTITTPIWTGTLTINAGAAK